MSQRMHIPGLIILLSGFAAIATSEAWAGDQLPGVSRMSADAVAGQVDRLIDDHLQSAGVVPAGSASDNDLLRRLSLDLLGRIPTPQELTLFGLDPDQQKTLLAIDRMVESEDFARTWARYWREVVFSRATEVRSRIAQPAFEDWMTEQLHHGAGWDTITTELITATGNTREEGSTALIFAQGGDPAEIAAEVSRIFLGIQIQCANCHDHPYDQWKRKDFHELAAFFPRVRLRRDGSTQPATFSVESADDQRDRRGQVLDTGQIFRFLDRNRDGRLTRDEARRSRQFGQRFERIIVLGDKNSDGAISREELQQLPRPPAQPGRGTAEYYMPDLENPAAPGVRIEPVFFIDEQGVNRGTVDLERRGALASSITSPTNPWFARAFINRIWAEMLGEGFYTPIDDIGPDRAARYDDVLDVLAAGFVANDYDVKWVYRTIARTTAYQRTTATGEQTDEWPRLAMATPTRLRGDQLYNAVTQVLGVNSLGRSMARGSSFGAMRSQSSDVARIAFGQLFNHDPSTPRTDLRGSIPQALFLMNSRITSAVIHADEGTKLGRLLRQFDDNKIALSELYLLVLSREPTTDEASICHKYIEDAPSRNEGFEDILWTLMNSTEFLTKR